MYVAADSLDDLLAKVYKEILKRGQAIVPTKGPAREINGALLNLRAPRLRLSRTESRAVLFTALGELLWMLAGSKAVDFITHYISHYQGLSDDGGVTIHGAYGPRLFGPGDNNQVHRVINVLKEKNDSRQAVIQIFDRTDLLEYHRDVPCTCTLQFLVRKGRLNLLTYMRSNDAWMGLPHDIFAFTMLQELVARSLGIELGQYKHSVGSLHLYDSNAEKAIRYLKEGFQTHKPMPRMPTGDPWAAVSQLLEFEKLVRESDQEVADPRESMPEYWADLANLLAIHRAFKTPYNQNEIQRLKRRLNSEVYAMYINRRSNAARADKGQVTIFDTQTDTQKGKQ